MTYCHDLLDDPLSWPTWWPTRMTCHDLLRWPVMTYCDDLVMTYGDDLLSWPTVMNDLMTYWHDRLDHLLPWPTVMTCHDLLWWPSHDLRWWPTFMTYLITYCHDLLWWPTVMSKHVPVIKYRHTQLCWLLLRNYELQHSRFATSKFSAAHKSLMPASRTDCCGSVRRHKAPGALAVCVLSAVNVTFPCAINFLHSYRSTALALWGGWEDSAKMAVLALRWSCTYLCILGLFNDAVRISDSTLWNGVMTE
jgi:hypothetical protein